MSRDLGDGLLLRRTTQVDTDALCLSQSLAFANPDTGEPDIYLGGWTRDLMNGKHPTFQPDDFFVVENTKTGELVSSLCLISQVWTMEGIPFPDLTFLKLLFGYRSRAELQAMYPDCFMVQHEVGALLDVLFPKKLSHVIPLH